MTSFISHLLCGNTTQANLEDDESFGIAELFERALNEPQPGLFQRLWCQVKMRFRTERVPSHQRQVHAQGGHDPLGEMRSVLSAMGGWGEERIARENGTSHPRCRGRCQEGFVRPAYHQELGRRDRPPLLFTNSMAPIDMSSTDYDTEEPMRPQIPRRVFRCPPSSSDADASGLASESWDLPSPLAHRNRLWRDSERGIGAGSTSTVYTTATEASYKGSISSSATSAKDDSSVYSAKKSSKKRRGISFSIRRARESRAKRKLRGH